MAIELKRPGQEPTPLQAQELRRWRGAHGYAVWTDNRHDLMRFVQDVLAMV